jgi:hypothetical protein
MTRSKFNLSKVLINKADLQFKVGILGCENPF